MRKLAETCGGVKTTPAKNPAFLLYSGNGGIGFDWWPRKLKNDGYVLSPVVVKPKSERDYLHRVFLVSRGKTAE